MADAAIPKEEDQARETSKIAEEARLFLSPIPDAHAELIQFHAVLHLLQRNPHYLRTPLQHFLIQWVLPFIVKEEQYRLDLSHSFQGFRHLIHSTQVLDASTGADVQWTPRLDPRSIRRWRDMYAKRQTDADLVFPSTPLHLASATDAPTHRTTGLEGAELDVAFNLTQQAERPVDGKQSYFEILPQEIYERMMSFLSREDRETFEIALAKSCRAMLRWMGSPALAFVRSDRTKEEVHFAHSHWSGRISQQQRQQQQEQFKSPVWWDNVLVIDRHTDFAAATEAFLSERFDYIIVTFPKEWQQGHVLDAPSKAAQDYIGAVQRFLATTSDQQERTKGVRRLHVEDDRFLHGVRVMRAEEVCIVDWRHRLFRLAQRQNALPHSHSLPFFPAVLPSLRGRVMLDESDLLISPLPTDKSTMAIHFFLGRHACDIYQCVRKGATLIIENPTHRTAWLQRYRAFTLYLVEYATTIPPEEDHGAKMHWSIAPSEAIRDRPNYVELRSAPCAAHVWSMSVRQRNAHRIIMRVGPSRW